MTVPNLDAMSDAQLDLFSDKHLHGRAYADLFPKIDRSTLPDTAGLARCAYYLLAFRLCQDLDDAPQSKVVEDLLKTDYARLSPRSQWRRRS
mgnify:CR=1 FL=1